MIIHVLHDCYLCENPPREQPDGLWRVAGKRWIKSRKAWAKSGQSFVTDKFEIEKPTSQSTEE